MTSKMSQEHLMYIHLNKCIHKEANKHGASAVRQVTISNVHTNIVIYTPIPLCNPAK